eukprot:COSAG02_NODE_57708_length_279_cov_1.994444_1_plen_72_part_10
MRMCIDAKSSCRRVVQLAAMRAFFPMRGPSVRRIMRHDPISWIALLFLLTVLLRPLVRSEIVVAATDSVVGA